MESLPEFHGQLHRVNDGFYIVAIHMKHGRAGYLGNIGTVSTRTCLQVIGGKAHLVVDHQMNGSPGFIARQLRHLDHFVYNPLGGNGRIAMNHDRGHLVEIFVVMRINA